jgi:hypothetical protein
MLDINTLIHMTRILPLGLAAGKYYTLFYDSSMVTATRIQLYESTTVPLSYFLFSIHQQQFRFLHFTFSDLSITTVIATTTVTFHMILQ